MDDVESGLGCVVCREDHGPDAMVDVDKVRLGKSGRTVRQKIEVLDLGQNGNGTVSHIRTGSSDLAPVICQTCLEILRLIDVAEFQLEEHKRDLLSRRPRIDSSTGFEMRDKTELKPSRTRRSERQTGTARALSDKVAEFPSAGRYPDKEATAGEVRPLRGRAGRRSPTSGSCREKKRACNGAAEVQDQEEVRPVKLSNVSWSDVRKHLVKLDRLLLPPPEDLANFGKDGEAVLQEVFVGSSDDMVIEVGDGGEVQDPGCVDDLVGVAPLGTGVAVAAMVRDFEEDLKALREEMPNKIGSDEDGVRWNIRQLIAEDGDLAVGLANERVCCRCLLRFPTVGAKIDHLLQRHHRQVVEVDHEDAIPVQDGGAVPAPFSCSGCPDTFNREADAWEHQGLRSPFCSAASGRTPSSGDPGYRGHHRQLLALDRNPEKNWEQQLICKQCCVVSSSRLAYWWHWYLRHGKYRHLRECPVCRTPIKASGDAVSALRRHVLIAHRGYRFGCPECPGYTVDGWNRVPAARVVGAATGAWIERQRQEVVDHLTLNHRDLMLVRGTGKRRRAQRVQLREARRQTGSTVIRQHDDEDSRNDNSSSSAAAKTAAIRNLKPLDRYEVLRLGCDQRLEPLDPAVSRDLVRRVVGRHPWMRPVMAALEEHVGRFRTTTPSVIDRVEAAEAWDLTLLMTESVKLNFGIPGETVCFHCDTQFPNVHDKLDHVVAHHGHPDLPGRRSYVCVDCDDLVVFAHDADATRHRMDHHHHPPQVDDNADLCRHPDDGRLMDKTPLVLMGAAALEGPLYSCRDCGVACATELAFWLHSYVNHRKFRGLRCPECLKVCPVARNFRRHFLVAHAGFVYRCNLCPASAAAKDDDENDGRRPAAATFETHSRLLTHVNWHKTNVNTAQVVVGDLDNKDNQGPQVRKGKYERITCQYCLRVSNGIFRHSLHLLHNHNVCLAMTCRHCGGEFESADALQQHQREEHPATSCPYCAKKFVRKDSLTNHLELYHDWPAPSGKDTSKVICEVCSMELKSIYTLKAHMKQHQEKKFRCHICPNKAYFWQGSLDQHMRTHFGGRNFKCDTCGRAFADSSNLKKHLYTHSQEKPHTCPHCQKGFIRKDFLVNHSKSCAALRSQGQGLEV